MPQHLPYAADDDDDAIQYVREALRRSCRRDWAGLLADDRATQTYRVLRRIEARATHAQIHQRDTFRQAEIDRDAGRISDDEFAEKRDAFVAWRQRAAGFDEILRSFLDRASDRVQTVRRDTIIDCLRSSLLTLALAVHEHRNIHNGEESLADTALWARLNTLPWPLTTDTEPRSLADAVATELVRRGPARATSDGYILFEGHRIPGLTVDVADLVLEVTDHADPSVTRPKLVEMWKQRAPDLLDTEPGKVATERQIGHYASQVLRRTLRHLENLDLIERIADKHGDRVTVTDRHRLGELRRRWDDKHFGMYDLGH